MADIQTLVNNIPLAQDGNLITSNYHNTIRAALEAIAGQVGGAAAPAAVTLTLHAAFSPVATFPQFNLSMGVATLTGTGNAAGYIPLNLPDGAVIQQLTISGANVNSLTSSKVSAFANLQILAVSGGGSPTTLIQVNLVPGGNPFSLSGTPNAANVPGITATAITGLQTVQNSQFMYAIEVIVRGDGATQASLEIYAFQLVYQPAS